MAASAIRKCLMGCKLLKSRNCGMGVATISSQIFWLRSLTSAENATGSDYGAKHRDLHLRKTVSNAGRNNLVGAATHGGMPTKHLHLHRVSSNPVQVDWNALKGLPK